MNKALSRFLLLILLSIPLSLSPAFAQVQGDDAAQPKPAENAAQPKPGDDAQAKSAREDKSPYADAAVKAYNRGVELHQSGFLNQAIDEYKKAIQADERMEEAYSNLGVIYAAQRSFAKAQEAFTKALSLKPARPTTLNGLATVLYARGNIKEAKERWQQALVIDPNFASAYYNIGTAQESEKDLKGAIESYAHAIDVKPDMADAYYRMGSIYNHQGHLAVAQVLLEKAVSIAPASEFVRDAKRQLTQIESHLAREGGKEATVQAVKEAGEPLTPGRTQAAARPEKEMEKPKEAKEDGREKKKFELFKHKTKPAQASKVDMSAQPSDESDKTGDKDADLAPAP